MMNWQDLVSVRGLIKVLFQHFLERTEENHRNPHSYKPKPLPPHQQVTLSCDICHTVQILEAPLVNVSAVTHAARHVRPCSFPLPTTSSDFHSQLNDNYFKCMQTNVTNSNKGADKELSHQLPSDIVWNLTYQSPRKNVHTLNG
jgi:hypothetical protein